MLGYLLVDPGSLFPQISMKHIALHSLPNKMRVPGDR